MRALLAVLLLLAAAPPNLSGQAAADPPSAAGPTGGPDAPSAAERYRVFLLTMDQGDAMWERFGHNAILVEDRLSGDRLAWNWGLFDFQAENFLLRFARGTMPFSMGPADLEPFVASYAAANRSVYANQVYLTQEEAAALDEFVRWNFQPENREYVYDYFLDNCSTRVRDALDLVLGGLIRESLEDVPTPRTYRWQVRRAARGIWWIDQGLNLLMGSRTDRTISAWEASFLPVEFLEHASTIQRTGPDGGTTPLLGPRTVLFLADRGPVAAEPSGFSLLWLLAGAGASLALVALGRTAARGHRWAALVLGASVTAWGVVSGVLALLLTLLWLTAHEFGWWNANILYLSPVAWVLTLAAAWALLRGFRPESRAVANLSAVAFLVAGLSLVAALLQVTTLVRQDTLEVLAVALPVNVGAAMALWRYRRGPAAVRRPAGG